MYKFGRYFAVAIAITMVFLANTVNVSFSPIILREVESTEEFSADRGSMLTPTQPKSGFYSGSKEVDNGKSESSFQNLWGLNAFDNDSRFDGIEERGDFACFDEDSAELVIGVNNAKPEAYADLVDEVSRSQGEIVNKVSIEGEVIAVVADIPWNATSPFTEKVQKIGLARYVEPNMKFQAQFVPNDPYWTYQWGPQKIEADYAWNTNTGDSSILVAVIDTGIDYNHPDLEDNYVPLGRDWVNDDEDPLDDFGHGTHCAGIVSAVLNNTVGIAGIANVSIMAEKGLDAYGSGWEDDLANAIIHAVDQSANILSNSWGGYGESYLIHDAVQYAYERGVLVVAAAGNEATSDKLYPAAYDEVVAVTATDRYDNSASFTNFGDWVEVAAPGVDIYSTMPTYHVTMNDWGYSMNYTYMDGTSMACPHAAGVAALIWSQFSNAMRDWVRAQLRYISDDLGNPGFDEYYGYGRINARKAVEQTPPDHDLLIFDWERPSYIQPGDIASFNVAVLNFGANDEENVTVQLLVDKNLTDSTLIDYLTNGTLTTVSLSWNPLVERTYNVTLYVMPVSGETATENNIVTEMVSVRSVVGFALWDDTHDADGDSLTGNYLSLYQLLSSNGFAVDELTSGTINYGVLAPYDILVLVDPELDFSSSEITDIQDWVAAGGSLIVIPDGGCPPSVDTLMTPYGVQMTGRLGGYGETTVIVSHPITQNVTAIYVDWVREISVTSPSTCLAWATEYGESYAFLSVTDDEKVVVISDSNIMDNYGLEMANNTQLMLNIFNCILVKYEHELTVRLEAPSYIEPGEASLLNATVYNRGLNNETDVKLQLLIDDALVRNITIPELVNGTSRTMNYSWTTPSVEAVCNVTAYAPLVPDENVTRNNVNTKYVHVQYPLINPVEGQYANYVLNVYDISGYLTGTGYWNLTYDYYIEPYKIYITIWSKDPSGYISTGWMIVNTMNRLVESGVWASLWYPGWIETDIDIGSIINLLSGTATVNGSRIIMLGPRAIDCWELSYSEYGYQYTFWYDKASGLWIGMVFIDPYYGYQELLLLETNVSIGTQYEHDLGVTLDTPKRLQLDENSLLNATVYNLGLNNETEVKIQLLINGKQVANKTLAKLVNGTWHTINYSWTPTTEGIYNITAYAPPVPSENVTANNIITNMVNVRRVKGYVLFDQTHWTDSITYYSIWVANLTDRGYIVDTLTTSPITPSMLEGYDVFVIPQAHDYYSSTELSVIQDFVLNGGGLLVIGDDNPYVYTDLTSFAGITWVSGGYSGYTSDITPHPVTEDVNTIYFSSPSSNMYITSPAIDLIRDYYKYIMLAVSEIRTGKVIGIADENTIDNYDISYADNFQLANNMIDWLTVKYEHELTVHLDAPSYLDPGENSLLNATVYNTGLNNETNVELQLLINDTVVDETIIPKLVTGESYTISHLWTPTIAGTYNITVHAPPVLDENVTINNVYSKFVPVQYAPRILAYVEYTDYYQDYTNTLKAIESTFGPAYILTELWDYTQLDSMLPGKDILLIPDQEYASLYTMEMIGAEWSETLTEFLENGGTIILCDGFYGYGGTYGILTGAGLMSISGANYRSYYTLYLVDPSDPLAEGVPSSFVSPYYTVSFVTEETNVVIEDEWHYPVVIHKEMDRGHIALLGFDFESSNVDTEQLLGNAVALAAYIPISVNPSAGSPETKVTVTGTKATANGIVSIYWDDILIENITANAVGDFTYLMTVPSEATVGVHEIMAMDIATGRTGSTPFRVILIALNPTEGPIGTNVTVNGSGFAPESQVTVTFSDMLIGYTIIDSFENFTFTFNIPLSTAGKYYIKALDAEGNYAFATFTVIDVTPLDVQIDVGAMHFKGEIAEFYTQTTFKGRAVGAIISSAILYKPDGTVENLLAQDVAIGLYKIPYAIPGDAEPGTYTLVVTAQYVADKIQAAGTSFKCFVISSTLTNMNMTIQELQGDIATIVIPNLGTIKADLTAINATLVDIEGSIAVVNSTLGIIRKDLASFNAVLIRLNETTADIQTDIGKIQVTLDDIQLKVIAINEATATIQTILGTMNGTITSIKDNIATIVIPGVGQIETDISSLKETQETWVIPQYVIIILALIAAASSTLSVIFLKRRKTTKAE